MSISEEKAIEFVRDKIAHLQRHIESYEKSKCKTAVYQSLVKEKEAIETLIETLKKKDKIIDELAPRIYLTKEEREQMKKDIWNSRKGISFSTWVKQYFEKKVEEE